jgi:hypothetical protein
MTRDIQQYRINGELWPTPDSTSWGDVQNGEQLSTAIPVYSAYRVLAWAYAFLPNCDFAARAEAIRGTRLTSLITDPPDDAEEPIEYTDVSVQAVERVHSRGQLTGVNIRFLVFVG